MSFARACGTHWMCACAVGVATMYIVGVQCLPLASFPGLPATVYVIRRMIVAHAAQLKAGLTAYYAILVQLCCAPYTSKV